MSTDELRDKGFNFPFILHNLITDINTKEGAAFIEGTMRLYDNIKGAYDIDGSWGDMIDSFLEEADAKRNKIKKGVNILVAWTPEAKAAAMVRKEEDFKHEYNKARLIFRESLKKIENLMPEKIIHGQIEDEDD